MPKPRNSRTSRAAAGAAADAGDLTALADAVLRLAESVEQSQRDTSTLLTQATDRMVAAALSVRDLKLPAPLVDLRPEIKVTAETPSEVALALQESAEDRDRYLRSLDETIATLSAIAEQTPGASAQSDPVIAQLRDQKKTLAGRRPPATIPSGGSNRIVNAINNLANQLALTQPFVTAFGQQVQGAYINQVEADWHKTLAQNAVTASGSASVDADLSKLVVDQPGVGTSYAISDQSIAYRPARPMFLAFTFRLPDGIPSGVGDEIVMGGARLSDADEIALVAHSGELHLRVTREGGSGADEVLHDVPQSQWNRDRMLGGAGSTYGYWNFGESRLTPAVMDTSKEQLAILVWSHLGAIAPTLYFVPPGTQHPVEAHTIQHINVDDVTVLRNPNVQMVMRCTSATGADVSVESGSWAAGIIDDPTTYTRDQTNSRLHVQESGSVAGAASPVQLTVYTVSPGRRLRVMSMGLGAFNDVSSGGDLLVRDGTSGPVLWRLPVPPQVGLAVASTEQAPTFEVPLEFDDAFVLDVPTIGVGTTAMASFVGFEEATS